MNHTVLLWSDRGRKGPIILREDYERIATTIVNELQSNPQRAIDLHQLIDQIRCVHVEMGQQTLDWYFLKIKLDLEQRGIIKISINRDYVQTVILKKCP
jgi:hypothetical protein